jgi:hypothetical protein
LVPGAPGTLGRGVTLIPMTGHAHRPGYQPLTVADLGN